MASYVVEISSTSPRPRRLFLAGLFAFFITHGPESAINYAEQSASADLRYVLNEDGIAGPRSEVEIPEHLVKAVTEAEAALTNPESKEPGALIFTVLSEDGKLLEADAQVHHVGKHRGGYRPYRIIEDDPVVHIDRHKSVVEVRVLAEGYQTFTRKTVIREGQIIIWDDIVLDRIKPGEGTTITGTVRLADRAAVSGLEILVDGVAMGRADEKGRFTISGLRAGELRISAHKRGYIGLHETTVLDKGDRGEVDLVGYRAQAARVRWAYQPDGSMKFGRGIPSGEAIVSPNELDRISFAEDFKQVSGKSDFLVYQVKDSLKIKNFDQSGQGPGFVEVENTPFEKLIEAPRAGYQPNDVALQPGRVYVFRCYDGEHYAKMEVRELLDTAVSDEE